MAPLEFDDSGSSGVYPIEMIFEDHMPTTDDFSPALCSRPRCHHPLSLHKNGTSYCHALGCHAGQDGNPCPEFMTTQESETST